MSEGDRDHTWNPPQPRALVVACVIPRPVWLSSAIVVQVPRCQVVSVRWNNQEIFVECKSYRSSGHFEIIKNMTVLDIPYQNLLEPTRGEHVCLGFRTAGTLPPLHD